MAQTALSVSSRRLRVHFGLHALQGEDPYRWFGIGRYVRELALHLAAEHRDLLAALEFDRSLPLPGAIADFAGLGLLRQQPYDVRPLQDEAGFRIYHAPSPFTPFPPHVLFPGAHSRLGTRLVVTLHDLIPLVYADTYLAEPSVRGWYNARLQFVRSADLVVAVSQSAKDDAVRLIGLDPERVRVTHLAASPAFRPAERARGELLASVRSAFPDISMPFLLYAAGAADPRKNVEGLVRAYSLLPDAVRATRRLVITGGTPAAQREKLLALVQALGLSGRVALTGFVSDEALRDLYQACDLSVFPSLYEGFGLPVLEAMQCGAPVVVADRTSLREIVEPAEARFDPDEPEQMASVITGALADDAQARLRDYSARRARDFSWRRTAQETVAAYEWLAETSLAGPPRGRRRPAFAVAGPEGPLVASAALALRDRYGADIDIVLHRVPAEARGSARPRRVSEAQFRWLARRGRYDAVLYLLGSGPGHVHALRCLRDHGGVAWLQDLALAPLYRAEAEAEGLGAGSVPRPLRRWTRRYAEGRGDVLLRDAVAQRRDSVYLLGEVASRSSVLIVGSEAEREIAEAECGGRAPIVVIPRETWSGGEGIAAVCRALLAAPLPPPEDPPPECCREDAAAAG
jgi:glycosyltransferase involved in cell wall biosynthesis